jgi:hypothetical protein
VSNTTPQNKTSDVIITAAIIGSALSVDMSNGSAVKSVNGIVADAIRVVLIAARRSSDEIISAIHQLRKNIIYKHISRFYHNYGNFNILVVFKESFELLPEN